MSASSRRARFRFDKELSMLLAILESLTVVLMIGCFCVVRIQFATAQNPSALIGERPALQGHLNEADVENGSIKFNQLLEIGESIFAARWTKLDGQGRPAATGSGTPTKREPSHDPGFLRTSGTDATSCADCHNQPTIGGAGGFVANVFVLAQNLDPITDSIAADFSNERNTLEMNGSGAIEMLAREMTANLLTIRDAAVTEANSSKRSVTRRLDTKGVNFGQKDSKGNVINTHDFDEDGVPDELTVGDITAATLFQVALNVPVRVIANDPARRAAAERGEEQFSAIGCADCHKPALILDSRLFTEPNPYNPAGNLRVQDVRHPYTFDMTIEIPKPRLERWGTSGAIVHAYTDLKHHVICDSMDQFFCNERVIQSGVPVDQFLTRKLWDVGNTAPYGHRGDLTPITEAIMHHAGEARPARERFEALSKDQQAEIVEFLKQLQILPNGSPRIIDESDLRELRKTLKSITTSTLSEPKDQP